MMLLLLLLIISIVYNVLKISVFFIRRGVKSIYISHEEKRAVLSVLSLLSP